MRFENKVVQITGAGSGIGRATAIKFAREGAKVGVADLKSIFAAAHQSGVDHFFLERDMAADPENTLESSFAHLKTLAA